MPKKLSDREKLLAFAFSADEDQLTEALEIFRSALRAKQPVPKRRLKARAGGRSKDALEQAHADRSVTHRTRRESAGSGEITDAANEG